MTGHCNGGLKRDYGVQRLTRRAGLSQQRLAALYGFFCTAMTVRRSRASLSFNFCRTSFKLMLICSCEG